MMTNGVFFLLSFFFFIPGSSSTSIIQWTVYVSVRELNFFSFWFGFLHTCEQKKRDNEKWKSGEKQNKKREREKKKRFRIDYYYHTSYAKSYSSQIVRELKSIFFRCCCWNSSEYNVNSFIFSFSAKKKKFYSKWNERKTDESFIERLVYGFIFCSSLVVVKFSAFHLFYLFFFWIEFN